MKNLIEIRKERTVIHVTSKGKQFEVLIDLEDLERITKKTNKVSVVGYEPLFYAMYYDIETKKMKPLHRLIMETPGGLVVDHINHNGLDNRKCNLRNCTQQENGQNARWKPKKNNRFGDCFRGVRWEFSTGKYRASCTISGVKHNLGAYDTPEEANDVVVAFRKKYMPFTNEYQEVKDT